MSREFGSYCNGYFHSQIEYAAEDCENGDCEITRLWGKVLRSMTDVAYAISSAEANDSGEWFPIKQSIEDMASVQDAINDVGAYLTRFRDLIDAALRDALKKEREEKAI